MNILDKPIRPKADPPHKQDVEEMNVILKELGGTFQDGRPFWRISWADNEYEFRRGVFDTYHEETGIWLERKFHDALRVPKYQHEEMRGKWILEKLHLDDNPEVVNEGLYRYNSILIFQDGKKEYLRPRIDICQMAIYAWRNQVEKPLRRLTDNDLQDKWMKEEFEKNRTFIENQPDPKTIHWKPIVTDIHDLGANKLNKG